MEGLPEVVLWRCFNTSFWPSEIEKLLLINFLDSVFFFLFYDFLYFISFWNFQSLFFMIFLFSIVLIVNVSVLFTLKKFGNFLCLFFPLFLFLPLPLWLKDIFQFLFFCCLLILAPFFVVNFNLCLRQKKKDFFF